MPISINSTNKPKYFENSNKKFVPITFYFCLTTKNKIDWSKLVLSTNSCFSIIFFFVKLNFKFLKLFTFPFFKIYQPYSISYHRPHSNLSTVSFLRLQKVIKNTIKKYLNTKTLLCKTNWYIHHATKNHINKSYVKTQYNMQL